MGRCIVLHPKVSENLHQDRLINKKESEEVTKGKETEDYNRKRSWVGISG